MSSGVSILFQLKNRYIRLRLVEIVVLSISVAAMSYSVLLVIKASVVSQIALPVALGIVAFGIRFFQLGLNKVTERSVATFLNTQYTKLEGSTDLILVISPDLPPLAKIQQTKTIANLESINKEISFPNRIKTFSILLLIALATCQILRSTGFTLVSPDFANSINSSSINPESIAPEILPAEIKEATVTVTPPAYTRIRSYTATDLNLTLPENSKVTWSLKFSDKVKSAGLVSSSQQDTLQFKLQNDTWRLTTSLDRNGFYQLIWTDDSKHSSDYYKIFIVKDQSPILKINNLNQFTQVEFTSKQSIEANASISDDYGLTDAYIIATVSKGSGESVKFREEKIRFSTPQKVTGKQINARQILDLKKLGMQPGDELYFYVEAFDTKTPVANRSRTETYFISLPDTAQDVMTADGGLGVDLMPEYFRSQRQIIIDTEKLIREKKTISKKEFNSRSNELGYDQKVLRLRYGQFVGEEAESGTGPIEQHAEEDHEGKTDKPEDMIKEFGHQHDTENEHNLVEEKDQAKKDVDGSKKEDLLAGFVHAHDNEESATFFYQSLKMKLKAALAQMWDAELYLRLYEPDKSLPYQYTALRLLKEISNDSRIYVHRTGFEPPPIKEEKRLSADLTEIFNASHNYEAAIKEFFPGISKAIPVTEKLLTQQNAELSEKDRSALIQSGSELAQAALENPVLLQGLSALKEITTENGKIKIETINALRKSYWLALPKQPVQTGKKNSMLHELDTKLILQLELPEQ